MTIALILGCAVLPDGTPSLTFERRIAHGAALLRSGRVRRICVTGGQRRFGRPEAEVARDRLIALGVEPRDILVEPTSRNTFENIARALPLLGGGPVVLVSSRWHLPRARLVATILGLSVTSSGPASTAPFGRTMAAVLREVAATPVSVLRAVRWARRNAR